MILRLNPLALPTGTAWRFYMLTVVVVLISLNFGTLILFPGKHGLGAYYQQRSVEMLEGRRFVQGTLAEISRNSVITQKLSIRDWLWTFAPLGSVFIVFLLARRFYLKHPQQLRKKFPYTATPGSPVITKVLDACERTGIRPPKLRFTRGQEVQGHTFGFPPQETLLLHAPADHVEQQWLNTYQPVVYHELGHIAHRDTHYREWALAFWKVITIPSLIIVILLLLITLFSPSLSSRFFSFGLTLQITGLLLLMRFTWLELVRTREWFADCWAANQGFGPQLARHFSSMETTAPWERKRWWFTLWERYGDQKWWLRFWDPLERLWEKFGHFWHLHPSGHSRQQVLQKPDLLFDLHSGLPFVSGLLFTSCIFNMMSPLMLVWHNLNILASAAHRMLTPIFDTLPSALGNLLHVTNGLFRAFVPILIVFIPFCLLCLLIQGALGSQLQRYSLKHITLNAPGMGYNQLWKPAFLFALGIEAGWFLTPMIHAPVPPQYWLMIACCFLANLVLIWLWLSFQHAMTRCLIGTYTGKRMPERRLLLIRFLFMASLTTFICPLLFSRYSVWLSAVALPSSFGMVGIDIETVRYYAFFVTPFMLFLLAFFFFVLLITISWSGIALFQLFNRTSCPSCQHPLPSGFTINRLCPTCGLPLASWLYQSEMTNDHGG